MSVGFGVSVGVVMVVVGVPHHGRRLHADYYIFHTTHSLMTFVTLRSSFDTERNRKRKEKKLFRLGCCEVGHGTHSRTSHIIGRMCPPCCPLGRARATEEGSEGAAEVAAQWQHCAHSSQPQVKAPNTNGANLTASVALPCPQKFPIVPRRCFMARRFRWVTPSSPPSVMPWHPGC